MRLSKKFTTVTTLSKTIAFILFIALPFIGFYLGMKYQTLLDQANQPIPSVINYQSK